MFSKTKLLAFTLILLFIPTVVLAGTQASTRVHVAQDETIEGNFLAAGEQVYVDGTVEGDVIVAGGMVAVNGSVAGDVIAAGGQVDVTGPVQGDIRVAGGNVRIDGVVGKNATILGGDVDISRDSAVGWGLMLAAGNARVAGSVEKDIRAAVGNLQLDARVGENVWAKAGNVLVQSQTRIGGDLAYTAKQSAEVLSGAVIEGEVDYTRFETPQVDAGTGLLGLFGLTALAILFKLLKLLGLWLLGLVLLWSVPKFFTQTSKTVQEKFWSSLGKGGAFILFGPFLVMLLLLTLIGIPAALLFLSVWGAALIFGGIIVALAIGEPLLRKILRRHWRGVSLKVALLLGLVLLMFIDAIPFVGWLVNLLLVAVGTGAFLTVAKDSIKRLR